MFDSIWRSLVAAVLVLLVAGCSTSREVLDFDTLAELQINATTDVNKDDDGRPSPLVIRVFKLADARQFEREDFLALYEQAEDRLGRDLLGTIQLKEIAPGENRLEEIELTPEVKFLGIMAEYSRYGESRTTLVLPVRAHYGNDFVVVADDRGLAQGKD
ncbi:type VI secretion system lipoprotein TssJ [Parendozoicomonas haliclonae]|uniref:Type VI secretion lipoprotein n=1 Tax=Parendozoicomonas haliclonae TaxID=1960125 RepID=A0A1X7ATD1_9GAMM|nr:type VI secretion system lipoprotein TssJ [Parendozoicomonas haliclonae]SMA50667.1 Type VI secretion lipoprotein [Parendozoicomonas haliclonae]